MTNPTTTTETTTIMKNRLLILSLFATVASAQTPVVGPVTRHTGAGTGAVLSTHADLPGCVASAAAGTTTCKVRVVRVAPPAPAPAPAPSPAPAPAPAPTPTPAPPPAGAAVLYFSDCQTGAAAGCVPGSNANPGTAAAPKQNLAGVNISALPAGSQLLFARGGAWANFNVNLRNLNATPAAPLVLDAYGTGPAPLMVVPGGVGVIFGTYSDTTPDGGYTIRNLKIDGRGTGQWGFFVIGETRNVTIEANEITGFEIAVHAQNMGVTGNQALVVRNNNIHHNREMGMLGDAYGLIFDGNLVEANNFSASGFNHGLYLGGHATNGRVTNNRFVNNSVVNGVCQGGNLTVHGQWDGLVIEGNTITVPRAQPGCYGISINDGYSSVEFFRNVVVRGNTIDQVEAGIAVRAAPGILIEGNKVRSNQSIASGVVISPPPTTSDDPGLNPVVRNNVFCLQDQAAGTPVRINVAGGTESGNVTRRVADALTGACAR